MNSINFLAEPRRQSRIALVFYVLKFLRRSFRTLWPLLVLYFINSGKDQGNSFWLPIIIGVASIQLISSIIAYFRFFYYAREGELIIEKGVFQKTRLNIPFERIQTINFNQNVLHQILGVYEVKIDTAGSSGTELSIEALDKTTAEAIRDYVMRERALLVEQQEDNEATDGEGQQEGVKEAPKLMFQRTEQELLKIGISENHIQTFFIIVGFGFGWLQFGDDFFDIDYGELALSTIEQIGGLLSIAIAALVVGFLLLTIIVSLIRTVIRYYRLSVYESSNGFKIVAGLFTRKEQSAPFQKIQFMQWVVNPIQQLMDFRTIRLFQASSMAVSSSKALPMPGSSTSDLNAVLSKIFPEEERQDYEIERISPLIIARRVLYVGGIPALLFCVQGFLSSQPLWYLAPILWIAAIWLMASRFYKRYEIRMNPQIMEIHSGVFGRKYTLLRLFKVQAVEITQSPYQRRKAIANLELHTAAGTVKIPYLALDLAQEMRNYILYEVEREERDWM